MEWDYEKIEAAVCTLTEALGTICTVNAQYTTDTREIDPVGGFRNYELVPDSQKWIITITPKED